MALQALYDIVVALVPMDIEDADVIPVQSENILIPQPFFNDVVRPLYDHIYPQFPDNETLPLIEKLV